MVECRKNSKAVRRSEYFGYFDHTTASFGPRGLAAWNEGVKEERTMDNEEY